MQFLMTLLLPFHRNIYHVSCDISDKQEHKLNQSRAPGRVTQVTLGLDCKTAEWW